MQKQNGSSPKGGKKKDLHVTFKVKNRNELKSDVVNIIKTRQHLLLKEVRLNRAASTNNTDSVLELLHGGADPNYCDSHLRTPLHLSASRGYAETVKLLLQYGANPNSRDVIGNTPLHLAACTNNLSIITLLLNAGADVGSLDTHGRNPLQMAQGKLHLLQQNFSKNTIEMANLRQQLQLIIDLMISWKKRQRTADEGSNVEDLELIKLSLNSEETDDELVEDKMTRLMAELENFSLK